MSENVRKIAMRIRELREIAGVSAETLANEFGIPHDTFHSYERGDSDIPVSLLFKVAHRFNVELTDLLTGESPKLHVYSLTREGQGVSIERRRRYAYRSLACNFIHKKAEPFHVTVQPEPPGTPVSLSSHPGQEFDYLLEGKLKIIIDGHELVLNPGDSLYFDSGYDHGMQALDDRPAKFLAIVF